MPQEEANARSDIGATMITEAAVESNRFAFRWTLDDAVFDEAAWELRVGGTAVEIERKPLDVLAYLLRHAGEVVTKDELLDAAWPGRVVVEAALTNAVGKLRKALASGEQQPIATIARVGYRFVGRVERQVVERVALGTVLRQGDTVPRRPNWRLSHRLDEGDEGEVWLSEHIKTSERRVFKFSFDGRRLAGLKREVTIARLLHDSLGDRLDFVRVIDWDFETAPYFIESEFAGSNLESWAAGQGGLAAIPLEQRLQLLAQIGQTLATAHDLGVLHKDLKPANILIRATEQGTRACLVDFGSGKLLEPERLRKLGITRLGFTQTQDMSTDSLSGTLLYIAPELLGGGQPSVRSDIYALGVMLFQMCVGDLRRPMSAGWECEVADPLLREDIAHAAHGQPSLRMDSARELATRLQTLDDRRIQRQADLIAQERVKASEEVLARSRARRPWVIGAFAILSIAMAVVGYSYSLARRASQSAEHQAAVVKTMNDFLANDILAQADVDTSGQANMTVMSAIQNAAKKIDEKFDKDPEVAARLHETIGTVYGDREDIDDSTKEFEKAAVAYEKAYGVDDERALTARMKVLAKKLVDERTPEDAIPTLLADLKQISASAEKQAGTTGTSMLYKIDSLWGIYYADHERNWKVALPYAKASYERSLNDSTISDKVRAYVLNNYANDLRHCREFDEAARVLAEAIAMYTNKKGFKHPLTMNFRHQAVMVMLMQKHFAEAEPVAETLYEDRMAVLGASNTDTIDALTNWAVASFGQRKWQQAAELFAKQLELYKPLAEGWESAVVLAKANLAQAWVRTGRQREALKLVQSVLPSTISHFGQDSPFTNYVRYLIGCVALEGEDYDSAKALLTDHVIDSATEYARDPDWKASVDYARGRLAFAEGNWSASIDLLQHSVEEFRQTDPADFWKRQDAETLLNEARKQSAPRSGS
jgi:non-specific serine/threonine protein kinase